MASSKSLLPLLGLAASLLGCYSAPTTKVTTDSDHLLKVYIKVIDKKLNSIMQNCTEGRVGSALNITIGDQTVEHIIEDLPKCLHKHCGVRLVHSSICKHANKMHCGSFYQDISKYCKEPNPEHHTHHKCKPHCKELAVLKEMFRIMLLRPQSKSV